MKLTYRGVPYCEAVPEPTATIVENKEIIYRGNSPKARINPQFPWLKYIKQLFVRNSESKPVFDPITFWYDHKREFLDECWYLGDREQLDRCWYLTLKIEQTKASQAREKTKLKYRGVTYYKAIQS